MSTDKYQASDEDSNVPSHRLVECLEGLLEAAREGKINGVLVVIGRDEGALMTSYGHVTKNMSELLLDLGRGLYFDRYSLRPGQATQDVLDLIAEDKRLAEDKRRVAGHG